MATTDITTTHEYRLRRFIGAMWLTSFLIGVGYLILPAIVDRTDHKLLGRIWESVGAPMGMSEVLGFEARGIHFTLVTIAVLAVMAWLIVRTLRAMGPTLVDAALKLKTAGIAALVIVTFGIMLLNPWPLAAQTSGYWVGGNLISQLQTIRSQLELYQVQHNGNYPPLDGLWDHLTGITNAEGELVAPNQNVQNESEFIYGPYLQQPPTNPFNNNASVAADNSASWYYDETTGTFQAVLPWHKIRELRTSDTDTIPAPFPWLDSTGTRLIFWRIVYSQKTFSIADVISTPLVSVLAWCLLFPLIHKRLKRRLRPNDPYLFWMNRFALLCLFSFVGLLFSAFTSHDENAATGRLLFGFTFIWSLGGITYLLYLPHYQRAWSDGSACGYCAYDLTGTLAANGTSCPECGNEFDPAPGCELSPLRRAA